MKRKGIQCLLWAVCAVGVVACGGSKDEHARKEPSAAEKAEAELRAAQAALESGPRVVPQNSPSGSAVAVATAKPAEKTADELFAVAKLSSDSVMETDRTRALFTEFVTRFANDPRADPARDWLLKDRVRKITVSLNRKESFQEAVDELKTAVAECPTCASAKNAQLLIGLFDATLTRWPEHLASSVDAMMVRYADLKGKVVEIWPDKEFTTDDRTSRGAVKVAAGTYYNCAFKSESRWRSFNVGAGEPFHVYCKKGEPACEKLFAAATSKVRTIYNVRLKYPKANAICTHSQAELISFVKAGQWTYADPDPEYSDILD